MCIVSISSRLLKSGDGIRVHPVIVEIASSKGCGCGTSHESPATHFTRTYPYLLTKVPYLDHRDREFACFFFPNEGRFALCLDTAPPPSNREFVYFDCVASIALIRFFASPFPKFVVFLQRLSCLVITTLIVSR